MEGNSRKANTLLERLNELLGVVITFALMLMALNKWGKYMGLSRQYIHDLRKAGRIEGLIKVAGMRGYLVDSNTAKILPNPNCERRLTGKAWGRCKPLRGEEGLPWIGGPKPKPKQPKGKRKAAQSIT